MEQGDKVRGTSAHASANHTASSGQSWCSCMSIFVVSILMSTEAGSMLGFDHAALFSPASPWQTLMNGALQSSARYMHEDQNRTNKCKIAMTHLSLAGTLDEQRTAHDCQGANTALSSTASHRSLLHDILQIESHRLQLVYFENRYGVKVWGNHPTENLRI